MKNKSKSDRTSKKRRYKTPGGEVRIEYHKRKYSKITCGECGKRLHGVPTNVKGKSKSEKAPNRVNGGVLCSKCSRNLIKKQVREKIKNLKGE